MIDLYEMIPALTQIRLKCISTSYETLVLNENEKYRMLFINVTGGWIKVYNKKLDTVDLEQTYSTTSLYNDNYSNQLLEFCTKTLTDLKDKIKKNENYLHINRVA